MSACQVWVSGRRGGYILFTFEHESQFVQAEIVVKQNQ